MYTISVHTRSVSVYQPIAMKVTEKFMNSMGKKIRYITIFCFVQKRSIDWSEWMNSVLVYGSVLEKLILETNKQTQNLYFSYLLIVIIIMMMIMMIFFFLSTNSLLVHQDFLQKILVVYIVVYSLCTTEKEWMRCTNKCAQTNARKLK
jgi:hypothetical protein